MADLFQISAPDCTSDYVYEPLENPHSFRLIRIQPDLESSQHTHCTIERYERGSTECPPYTALSYVWGDASERRPVTLNGQRAFVTTNLYQALWNLRSVFPDVYFWIDALSIDQHNVGERGHQVNQMKAIYSGAKETVAWLGAGVEATGPLFEFVKEHEETCTATLNHMGHCSVPRGISIGDAIKYLERNAYWSRVWVVQELVSAASVSLMCGKHIIAWPMIVRFLKTTKRGHFVWGLGEIYRWIEGPNYESYIVTLSGWSRYDINLAEALARSEFSLATDYRDKVFAILGLINAGAGTRMNADYALSPCKVICEAIRAIAEDQKKDYYGGDRAYRTSLKNLYRLCRDANKWVEENARKLKEPECLEFAALHRRLRELFGYPAAPAMEQRKPTVRPQTYCEGLVCGSRKVLWQYVESTVDA